MELTVSLKSKHLVSGGYEDLKKQLSKLIGLSVGFKTIKIIKRCNNRALYLRKDA